MRCDELIACFAVSTDHLGDPSSRPKWASSRFASSQSTHSVSGSSRTRFAYVTSAVSTSALPASSPAWSRFVRISTPPTPACLSIPFPFPASWRLAAPPIRTERAWRLSCFPCFWLVYSANPSRGTGHLVMFQTRSAPLVKVPTSKSAVLGISLGQSGELVGQVADMAGHHVDDFAFPLHHALDCQQPSLQ